MARQRKDEQEATDGVRRDASGRELFLWEVDPADQVSRHPAAMEADEEEAGEEAGVEQPQGSLPQ